MKKTVVTTSLPPQRHEELLQLAKQECRTRSGMIRFILLRVLAALRGEKSEMELFGGDVLCFVLEHREE